MKKSRTDTDFVRQNDLAKIHIARKDLAMDDADYRAVIERITDGRHNSASTLNPVERKALLAEFKRFGWKPKPPADAAATPVPRQSARRMLWRIRKLAGARGEPYIDGLAKKMFGLSSVRFANDLQLHSILAALEIDRRRQLKRHTQGVKTDVSPEMQSP